MPVTGPLLDAPAPRASTTSLVPQERFGADLHRARVVAERSLAELARAADGRWLPDQLVAVERGHVTLSDRRVAELTSLYGLGASGWSAPRLDVVFDRSTARDLTPVRRPHERSGAPGVPAGVSAGVSAGDGADEPVGLVTRLVAVALVGGLDLMSPRPGDVLAAALDLGAADVAELIGSVVTSGAAAVSAAVEDLSSRVVVAEAGVLIGTTPAGSVIVTSRRGGVTVPACCALGDLMVGGPIRAL